MYLMRLLTGLLGCFFAVSCPAIHLALEHVYSPEEISWGLMQRRSLPEEHGMLFHYNPPEWVSFWMFNTYIDLSLAFLDADGVVREIHELKAYPELMTRLLPISDVYALHRVPQNHPVVIFFNRRTVHSKFAVSYALEVNAGWFQRHGIKVGDKLDLSHGQ